MVRASRDNPHCDTRARSTSQNLRKSIAVECRCRVRNHGQTFVGSHDGGPNVKFVVTCPLQPLHG